MSPRNRILTGEALAELKRLPTGQVDTIVTSPPYFNLRDYGVSGQIGQEAHVDQWVEALRGVIGECHRVLAPHGSLWLNLGDSYSAHPRYGAARKSLLLGPERLALALTGDGWLLRNKIIWAKTNPLPSHVRDRLTNGHEYLYLLTKRASYFFDLDSIRVPLTSGPRKPSSGTMTPLHALGALSGSRGGLKRMNQEGRSGHPLGKNPSDVWRFGSASYRGAHFATFPRDLIRRPIRAGCPQRVCTRCHSPWRRSAAPVIWKDGRPQRRPLLKCGCDAPTRPGLVLDPFGGSGTVAEVARSESRDWLLIELNPEYVQLARDRLSQGAGPDSANSIEGSRSSV